MEQTTQPAKDYRPLQIQTGRLLTTKYVIILLSCAGLFSCAHQPPQGNLDNSKKPVLAWRGKALVFDKVKDKKNTISIDVLSKRPSNMRMDVSAILGIYIGSFVWNDSQMQVLLAREKKFITGPANSDTMQELLKMQIDPHALFDIFWDSPLSKSEWSCQFDVAGLSKTCRHKNLAIQINWLERNGKHRLIEIDSPKVNTQLSLNELEDGFEIKPTIFQLKPPDGFRIMKL